MRYRYRLSLYDDDLLDQEIVDYLARSPRKQELMRSLMRAGFALIIKRQEENLSYLSAMSDEEKAFLMDKAFFRPSLSMGDQRKEIHESSKEPELNSKLSSETSSNKQEKINKVDHKSKENIESQEVIDSKISSSEPEDAIDFMDIFKQ